MIRQRRILWPADSLVTLLITTEPSAELKVLRY